MQFKYILKLIYSSYAPMKKSETCKNEAWILQEKRFWFLIQYCNFPLVIRNFSPKDTVDFRDETRF